MSRIKTSAQKMLITILAKASGDLHLYTLHRRARLSPAIIFETINQLLKQQLIICRGKVISLSDDGYLWVRENRWVFTSNGADKPWRQCPSEFTAPAHPTFRPVTPRISMLDSKRFPLSTSRQMPKQFRFINQFRAEVSKS